MSTFEAWPKIARWNREVVITEKIDGTNAAIIIEEKAFGDAEVGGVHEFNLGVVDVPGLDIQSEYHVYAQSRTRMITPINDNFGFAGWVQENAEALVNLLGPGRHFGEWYGKGIQRNYGLDHKRFALFNTHRWIPDGRALRPANSGRGRYELDPIGVDVVPVLKILGTPGELTGHHEEALACALVDLDLDGSLLVPGFERPEGVVLWHTAAQQAFKITLVGDEKPKGLAA